MICYKYMRKFVLDLSAGRADAGVMRQRHLGSDGLVTSALGMGCMGLSQGYGPADDDESVRAIRRAAELGVTMFDTAMSYGQGHNERLIGRALAGLPWPVGVATKFGIVRNSGGVHIDGRPGQVRGYCEASLSRLGVGVIDLYYLHRVDPRVPIADTVGAMAELVTEGKVRHLGVSEVTPAQLEQAATVHPVSAVQFEWSLAWREPEDDIVPAARRLGIGIVPYSPLGRGLLTATLTQDDIDGSDFRRGDPRFQGATRDHNLARAAALRRVADGIGLTPAQLALAWLLAQGPDVVPIPGTRRIDRIEQNAAAADAELSEDDLRSVDEAVPRAAWAGDRRSFAAASTSRRTGPEPG
jgi:aryl-alcohol dehydrogenase-like predicted oxidoreductase